MDLKTYMNTKLHRKDWEMHYKKMGRENVKWNEQDENGVKR